MTSVRTDVSPARELSGMESVMAAMSATMNAVIQGRGRLAEPLLREALDLLRAAHPVLGGRVVREAGTDGYVLRLGQPDVPALVFAEGDPDQLPTDAEVVLHDGAALSVRVTTRGDRFRLVFSCHHSLADGRSMLAYLDQMFSLYTSLATTGSANPGPARPVPFPPEQALSERGIQKLDFKEFLRQSYGEEAVEFFTQALSVPELAETPELAEPVEVAGPPAEHAERAEFKVARARLRLSQEKTAALVRLSKHAGVGMHGLIFAVAALAELLLEDSPEFLMLQLRSAVDVRQRVEPPITEPTSVTNFAGNSTALVFADRHSDPLDWAKRVRDQLATDVERGLAPQSLLQMSGSMNIMRELSGATPMPIPDTVFITNVGVLPPFRVPEGIVLGDVHGVIHSNPDPEQFAFMAQQPAGMARNRSYLVSTFDGRLNLDLFLLGGTEVDTEPLIAALGRAFDAVLSR